MKRSQMVSKLKTVLENIKGSDPDTNEVLWPSDDYVILSLLNEVEELGMLPPNTLITQNFGDTSHPFYLDTYANEWEDEDDKSGAV